MIKVTVIDDSESINHGYEYEGLIDPKTVSCLVELKNGLTKIYFNNHSLIVKESLDWLKKQAPSLFY